MSSAPVSMVNRTQLSPCLAGCLSLYARRQNPATVTAGWPAKEPQYSAGHPRRTRTRAGRSHGPNPGPDQGLQERTAPGLRARLDHQAAPAPVERFGEAVEPADVPLRGQDARRCPKTRPRLAAHRQFGRYAARLFSWWHSTGNPRSVQVLRQKMFAQTTKDRGRRFAGSPQEPASPRVALSPVV